MDDLINRLKETLIAMRKEGMPVRYRQSVHDAIHILVRQKEDLSVD